MRGMERPVRRGPVAAAAACLLSAVVACTGLTGPARATGLDAAATPSASPAAVEVHRTTALARSGGLDILHLLVNGRTVYPVADGYRDVAIVTALTSSASGAAVAVTGTAVVSRAGRTVQTFPLRGAFPLLSWDGRDHGRIVPGTYRVAVSVRSANGTERHATTSITVSRKRLQLHIASVRRALSGATLRITQPKAVRLAQQYGAVSVALRTTADVRGSARLLLRNPALGRPVSLPLQDGSHRTRSVPVPEGSTRLVLERRWEPGAATLRDLQVVWSYSTLD